MATVEGSVIACCPPGCHEHHPNYCVSSISLAYHFTPTHRVWFTTNFLDAVMGESRFTGWSFAYSEGGRPPLMKYDGDNLYIYGLNGQWTKGKYVWVLTGERGGPNNFWREGLWPD